MEVTRVRATFFRARARRRDRRAHCLPTPHTLQTGELIHRVHSAGLYTCAHLWRSPSYKCLRQPNVHFVDARAAG
jgi:hypothetical protein